MSDTDMVYSAHGEREIPKYRADISIHTVTDIMAGFAAESPADGSYDGDRRDRYESTP